MSRSEMKDKFQTRSWLSWSLVHLINQEHRERILGEIEREHAKWIIPLLQLDHNHGRQHKSIVPGMNKGR